MVVAVKFYEERIEAMVTLDELARDPTRAASLPPGERNVLIARCAAIVMALTATTNNAVTNQQSAQTTSTVKDEPLLTVVEVAEILRFGRSLVYELVRRGEIRAMHQGKYWRIRRSEVERFIADREGNKT